VNAQGGGANGPSAAPAMSPDGRYVAFFSQARNLVANGASGNIFVRDTCRGAVNCTPQTTAVDVAPDGSAPNASAGEHISISADGRFVAFVSSASNLTSAASSATGQGGMPPDSHVFVRDTCVGPSAAHDCTLRTTMVSVDSNGNPVHALSPSISGDGRFVAFVSWNRDQSADSSAGTPEIFVRDTCAGAIASCTPRTYRLPAESSTGWVGDAKPAISSDGRFVAFERWTRGSAASGGALSSRILMRDTCLGGDAPSGCLSSTAVVSISPDGESLSGASMFPSVNGDGRFVGFVSQSPDADSGVSAADEKMYLRDTCQGASAPESCQPSTAVIGEGVASIPGYPSAFSPWVSPSGRYVTFVAGASEQSNMNEAPREGILFVHDTCFGAGKSCVPRTFSVAAPSSGAVSAQALSVYKYSQIPLTADGAAAAFYSPFPVPAAPSSGMGDVYITVTNF
jgi:Tol biopolymer transport system component